MTKRMIEKAIIMVMVTMLVIVANAGAEDGLALMKTVLALEPASETSNVMTVAAGKAINLTIPADWEEQTIDETMGQNVQFQYRGTDSVGNEIYFSCIAFESPLDSYSILLEELEKMPWDSDLVTVNDIDMILFGDDAAAYAVFLAENGEVIAIQFSNDPTAIYYKTTNSELPDVSSLMSSNQLMLDVANIVHSMIPQTPMMKFPAAAE